MTEMEKRLCPHCGCGFCRLDKRELEGEIERLREALRKLVEACEDETAKIPYKDGDDELQRAKIVLGDN